MRINKFIAQAGITSRRNADSLILNGQVSINGKKAVLGDEVDLQRDEIKVDGKKVSLKEEYVYYILNKPAKVISTVSDKFGRKKVTDLIRCSQRIYPVGRLDYMSTGLIILTNDGDLTLKLTHPKFHHEKKYLVEVDKKISQQMIKKLSVGGIKMYGKETQPSEIKILGDTKFEIILAEGMKRQIRLMCKDVGLEVVSLKRISIGPIELGKLKEGEYREMKKHELKALKDIFKNSVN